MDGKVIRDKLVGSEEERAVSPVIGVILMVAITVILAAVIATLVMDFGDSTESPINAHVDSEVDGTDVTLSVTESGDADAFYLRGAGISSETNATAEYSLLGQTGSTATIDTTGSSPSYTSGETVNIVAVSGDREENVGSFEVP